MKDKFAANFYDGGIFHVYNRTNNKELLFTSDENRLYFLKQYAKYIAPFVDTYCWCLLPNHFHFLIQVKNAKSIKQYLESLHQHLLKPLEKKYLTGKATTEELIELEWKRFFTSYSMAFNKQQGRSGNLFHRPFKRVEVGKDSHFTQAVIYIHANALKHKLCKDFTMYKWSSWHSVTANKPTLLCKEQLLHWFGGINQFIEVHKGQSEFYYATDIAIEDE
jgi:putative transposase